VVECLSGNLVSETRILKTKDRIVCLCGLIKAGGENALLPYVVHRGINMTVEKETLGKIERSLKKNEGRQFFEGKAGKKTGAKNVVGNSWEKPAD